jgi:hypothetical protein
MNDDPHDKTSTTQRWVSPTEVLAQSRHLYYLVAAIRLTVDEALADNIETMADHDCDYMWLVEQLDSLSRGTRYLLSMVSEAHGLAQVVAAYYGPRTDQETAPD